MKQTAVEWLIDEWMHLDVEFDIVLIDKNTYWKKLKEKHNQAKEIEKEQMKNSLLDNVTKNEKFRRVFEEQFEQYYNKTFKNK